jgi:hypothetical protein
MKTPHPLHSSTRQRGIVSVIAVLLLSMVVLVILARSVSMKGAAALESQQYNDSVAALAVAESATELAKSTITALYNSTGSLSSSCSLTTPSPNSMGNGTFKFGPTAVDSSLTYCKFRVKGTVGKANRTIETWIGFTDQIGTAGNGRFPSLTLQNKFAPSQSLAIFNLAWLTFLQGGGNVLCADCSGSQLWYDQLTGSNQMGGVGNYASPPNNSNSVTYKHTLGSQSTDNRDYSMVGLLIGGTLSTPPTTAGWLKFSNTSASPGSLSQSAPDSGLGTGCTDDNANAVVLGISGTGNSVAAGFDLADLNGSITTAMWQKYVHYPNTDGSSPGSITDVFSEIFYYTRTPVFYTGASGSKNSSTITLPNGTSGMVSGSTIKVSTNNGQPGAGEIQVNTTYTVASSTTLTLSKPIKSNDLVNATLCSGICSMVPQVRNASTLTLSRNTQTLAKGWVAGIACIKDAKTATIVRTSSPHVFKWHEVLSTDTSF